MKHYIYIKDETLYIYIERVYTNNFIDIDVNIMYKLVVGREQSK